MSFLASILDSFGSTRSAKYGCHCGAVKIDLNVPGSSHVLVEQTTAICHCHDCMGFARACGKNGQSVIFNNGTQLVQFYKSDMKVVEGQDQIGCIKLKEGSPMIRCYCKKCGTPLGADMDKAPLVLLYNNLIQGGGVIYLPHQVLNFASAPSGTRSYDSKTVVTQGLLAPYFIIRVICRVILGLIMNKGEGGLAGRNLQLATIPVGKDKIEILQKED